MLIRRECLIAIRSPAQWLNPLVFFMIVVTLFPLGVGPAPERLSLMASGIIWVVALLASSLGAVRLFEHDYLSGVLEQYLLGSVPLYWVVQVKLFTHWVLTGLPLLVLVPVFGVVLFLPLHLTATLMMTVLLGLPVVATINAIGAALTLAARGGGILLLLICLPLQMPVIIFATGAVQARQAGLPQTGFLLLLAALLLLALAAAPFAIAAALRVAVQSR